jgi:hypothetical protein
MRKIQLQSVEISPSFPFRHQGSAINFAPDSSLRVDQTKLFLLFVADMFRVSLLFLFQLRRLSLSLQSGVIQPTDW